MTLKEVITVQSFNPERVIEKGRRREQGEGGSFSGCLPFSLLFFCGKKEKREANWLAAFLFSFVEKKRERTALFFL
jgi:hypothetical protein